MLYFLNRFNGAIKIPTKNYHSSHCVALSDDKITKKNSHSKLIIYLKENVIVKRNFKCLVPGDFPDTEKNLISRTKYLSILNLHK